MLNKQYCDSQLVTVRFLRSKQGVNLFLAPREGTQGTVAESATQSTTHLRGRFPGYPHTIGERALAKTAGLVVREGRYER